jgi:hypothetical protein
MATTVMSERKETGVRGVSRGEEKGKRWLGYWEKKQMSLGGGD